MLEAIERILSVLTPVFVAATTAYGAVLVAKISKVQKDTKATNEKVTKVQKDIVTNHGSKNLGDAIDRLTTKVNTISDNQDDLISTVKGMQARDESLEARMLSMEHSKSRVYKHIGLSPSTGPIHIKPSLFKRKKR
ncbi:membrane protein [Microbacterium phage Theresita]|nr:membrane protein [Microbacterium phage Theresita]